MIIVFAVRNARKTTGVGAASHRCLANPFRTDVREPVRPEETNHIRETSVPIRVHRAVTSVRPGRLHERLEILTGDGR